MVCLDKDNLGMFPVPQQEVKQHTLVLFIPVCEVGGWAMTGDSG